GLQDLFFVNGGETPRGKSDVPVRNALYHNLSNGKFEDVAVKAGVDRLEFYGMGVAVGDFDNDGFPELYVTGFPSSALFHNNGDGTFTDVSEKSGLAKLVGRALGLVTVDVNDDGWPDLFVARDASPNLLLLNKRDGTFEDSAIDADVAYDLRGVAKAGMGVDAGDVNGDGKPDFVVTNFNDEYHSLFVSTSSLLYIDQTVRSRLAAYTKSYVGWGAHFIDYDNDGNLDLLIVNGHINRVVETTRV